LEFFHVLFAGAACAAAALVASRTARARRTLSALEHLAGELGFFLTERTTGGGTIEGEIESRHCSVEMHAEQDSTLIIIGVNAPDAFATDARIALDPRQPIGLESDLGVTAAYVDGELLDIAQGAHFFSVDRGRAVLHWRLDALSKWDEDPTKQQWPLEGAQDRLHRFARWTSRAAMRSHTTPERLAESAMHNPDPATRIRALRSLRSCYPNTDAAHEARRAGLDDPYPEVRVEAATRLGPDGLSVLASIVRDPKIAAATRVRAIERLAYEATRPMMCRVLFDVAFDPDREVSIQAIERLARIADDATAARVITMARYRTLDEGPLIALSRFLGVRGGEEAAALLLSLLEVRSEPALIAAATESAIHLGPGVAARAMAILKDRPGLAKLGEARRAIEDLRIAIGEGHRGGLAFAGADAGTLSVSRGEKGAVSVDDE
jgi:hypothetical protein